MCVFSILHPTGDDVIVRTYIDGKQHGTHTPAGILAAYGPDVPKGKKVDADIIDIAPTILAYQQIPVPRHMDGKVLNEIFVKPPQIQYQDFDFTKSGQTEYSDDEQAKVEQHLADLGYI